MIWHLLVYKRKVSIKLHHTDIIFFLWFFIKFQEMNKTTNHSFNMFYITYLYLLSCDFVVYNTYLKHTKIFSLAQSITYFFWSWAFWAPPLSGVPISYPLVSQSHAHPNNLFWSRPILLPHKQRVTSLIPGGDTKINCIRFRLRSLKLFNKSASNVEMKKNFTMLLILTKYST